MELAVNTFSKGLQMDTNPMVLGNDTLTDCLNGTLITMNGNEVILLNDMGNRRVDNAFLPSGYLPVGIKEYGGIIYIAAYNPITNKSQIGSFPSPERKIDEHDDSGLGTSFDFEGGFTYDNDGFLISDTILLPLTKDISLHAGDKFAIFANLNSISNQLTNYNNVDPIDKTRALSPKNKKYTLSIGILNSLNEFVDITKTLCRWDSDKKMIEYDSEYSDIFKFNDGYFISNETLESFKDTIADSTLINERKRIAANTYSYKLIGPLYLKIQLNHIENFNYDILGTYDPDKKEADLLVTGYITYNCPDGIISEDKQNSNDLYITFNEGTTTEFRFFDFNIEKYQTTNSSNQNYYQLENKNSGNSKCIYNPGTNTYNIKVWKRYKLENILDTIINYNINVLANSELSDVYLKGLSVNDTLDLSLLGSGTVKLTEWKFYNKLSDDDFESKLKLSLNAYPKIGEKFNNLSIEFVGVDNKTGIITIGDISVYNGRQIIEFTGSTGLKKNKLYEVFISYDIIDEKSLEFLRNESLDNQTDRRWFLTTELFNDFFNDNSITDYCAIDPKDNQKFADKLNVKLYLDDNIEINYDGPNNITYGNLISEWNKPIEYGIQHNMSIILKGNPLIKIKNPELYPDFVKVISQDLLIGFDISNTPEKEKEVVQYVIDGESVINDQVDNEFRKRIEILSSNSKSDLAPMILQQQLKVTSTRSLNIELTYYDKYLSPISQNTGDNKDKGKEEVKFKYMFDRVSELAEEIENKEEYRAGLCMDTDEESGSRDEHSLYFIKREKLFNRNSKITDIVENSEKFEINHRSHDGRVTFFGNSSVEVSDWFNSKLPSTQVFAFCNYPVKSKDRNDPFAYQLTEKKGNLRGNDYARVWWRGSLNNWILLNGLFDIKKGTSTTNSSYYGNFGGNRATSGKSNSSLFGTSNIKVADDEDNAVNVNLRTTFGKVVVDLLLNFKTNYNNKFLNNNKLDKGDTTIDKSSNNSSSDSSSETLSKKFKNYLTSSFTKDYVYNMYTDTDVELPEDKIKKYWIAKDNYAHNYQYSIPVGFKLKYNMLSENTIQLCDIGDDRYKCGNLKFTAPDSEHINLISDSYATILLKSDPNFSFNIDKFYNNYESKTLAIDLVTGNIKDRNGNDLDINKIYSVQNGELVPENNMIFKLDPEGTKTSNNRNILLFNEKFAKSNCPSMRYDALNGSGDGTSLIDYSLVLLADKNICK